MSYPTREQFLSRTPKSMSWEEYGEYVNDKTNFTHQQSMILAGNAYRIDKSEIAEELNTSTNTVTTQSTDLDLTELDPQSTVELWKTPVPSVPFRLVGEISYIMSDEWERDGESGDVEIYIATKESDNYVAVIETWTLTEEAGQIQSSEGVWNCSEKRERTTIYETYEDFKSSSDYAFSDVEENKMDSFGIESDIPHSF